MMDNGFDDGAAADSDTGATTHLAMEDVDENKLCQIRESFNFALTLELDAEFKPWQPSQCLSGPGS